jgi:hypothetical protein
MGRRARLGYVARIRHSPDDPAMDLVIDGLDTLPRCASTANRAGGGKQFPHLARRHFAAAKSGNNRIEIVIRSSIPRGRAASGGSALLRSVAQGQLPDPQRQHAAQAAMRFRLGLEHRARAARRSWRDPAGAETRRGSPACMSSATRRFEGHAQPDCEDRGRSRGKRVEFLFGGSLYEAVVNDGEALELDVDEPALWWPAGLGEQVLTTSSCASAIR